MFLVSNVSWFAIDFFLKKWRTEVFFVGRFGFLVTSPLDFKTMPEWPAFFVTGGGTCVTCPRDSPLV